MPWKYGDDTAGPGRRFRDSKRSPFRFSEGKLVEFRPANAIQSILAPDIHPREKDILLEGFRAWVICPRDDIFKGKHKGIRKTSHADFIREAMALSATRNFYFALQLARACQLRKKKDWSWSGLMQQPALGRFPFEIFFAMGGLKMVLDADSVVAFKMKAKNQERPITNVVALMKIIHFVKVERDRDSKLKRWRMNKAREFASKLLADEQGPTDASGSDAIDDHWRVLKPSAPYIYAASIVQNGLMLRYLLEPEEEIEEPEQVLPAWFSAANKIAKQLLAPIDLLDSWASLDDIVPETPVELPPPQLDSRWTTYLSESLRGIRDAKLQTKLEDGQESSSAKKKPTLPNGAT